MGKGTYVQSQTNHARPVFKKEGSSGSVSVLIYFWDERDGPSFSGWWFGPKVGGDQVWAYNGDKAATAPPVGGWKVPWDGPVDQKLRLDGGGDARGGAAYAPSSRPSSAQAHGAPQSHRG